MSDLDRAKALLQRNELAEAEQVLWAVIRGSDVRAHEAWLRLGELHAARGHLRRAVGAFRRAQELDARGEYAFVLHEAVSALGQVLHRQKKPFLHPADELVRNRRLMTGEVVAPPREAAWLEAAEVLLPSLNAAGRSALEQAIGFVRGGVLDESWSEQSPARQLELSAGEEVKALAESLRSLHLHWYALLLDIEER